MTAIIDILEQLEANNSRLFKEELLEIHSDNELLRCVFVASFDPYTNYFISKFKMPKASNFTPDDDVVISNFLDFITTSLATRRITGNTAKDAVVSFFCELTERQQRWCLRILLRNLRVGVMESTINKIWPGSISKFSVQLAETLASTHEVGKGIIITEAIQYPVRVEPKLDGLRCIAIKHKGTVTMFTRSGSEIDTPGVQEIKRALENSSWDNFVLDGELLDEDGTWNSTASGVLKKKI